MSSLSLSMLLLCILASAYSFHLTRQPVKSPVSKQFQDDISVHRQANSNIKYLKMNFFDDAFRFFSNMNKEASAKHILIKGQGASAKLELLKKELEGASDTSAAFSELASKVSECPSASRGGNLGTFKPGMMVREFDRICFNDEVGKIHGPIETQFGHHLILITRRYEGEEKKS